MVLTISTRTRENLNIFVLKAYEHFNNPSWLIHPPVIQVFLNSCWLRLFPHKNQLLEILGCEISALYYAATVYPPSTITIIASKALHLAGSSPFPTYPLCILTVHLIHLLIKKRNNNKNLATIHLKLSILKYFSDCE